jgi:hypothetical protein
MNRKYDIYEGEAPVGKPLGTIDIPESAGYFIAAQRAAKKFFDAPAANRESGWGGKAGTFVTLMVKPERVFYVCERGGQ